jgi:hypothetical protein
MKNHRNAAGAAALFVVLAACSGPPTGMPANESRPSYDGGFGMGSGNREAPADGTLGGTSNASADTAGRSGYTVGSGN